MPPLGGKGKGKGREARRSRSRNTTPSSVVSAGVSIGSANTAYLDISTGSLMVPTNITYDDILERHGGSGGIPDPRHLEALAADLKTLGQLAETRGKACDKGMRELAVRRKERLEGDREKERATREAEEKEKMKREAEELDDRTAKKGAKLKKNKDRNVAREERPLTHGAHGVARQDGMDTQMTGKQSVANWFYDPSRSWRGKGGLPTWHVVPPFDVYFRLRPFPYFHVSFVSLEFCISSAIPTFSLIINQTTSPTLLQYKFKLCPRYHSGSQGRTHMLIPLALLTGRMQSLHKKLKHSQHNSLILTVSQIFLKQRSGLHRRKAALQKLSNKMHNQEAHHLYLHHPKSNRR